MRPIQQLLFSKRPVFFMIERTTKSRPPSWLTDVLMLRSTHVANVWLCHTLPVVWWKGTDKNSDGVLAQSFWGSSSSCFCFRKIVANFYVFLEVPKWFRALINFASNVDCVIPIVEIATIRWTLFLSNPYDIVIIIFRYHPRNQHIKWGRGPPPYR